MWFGWSKPQTMFPRGPGTGSHIPHSLETAPILPNLGLKWNKNTRNPKSVQMTQLLTGPHAGDYSQERIILQPYLHKHTIVHCMVNTNPSLLFYKNIFFIYCSHLHAEPTALVFSYSAQKTAISIMPRKITPAIQNWIRSRSFQ